MITFIKSWCEGIVIAVIISIIIEMIIPEGNNKKYIKVVIGIYILFVILNPILEKINTGYEIDDFFQIGTVETSTDLNNDIKDVYVNGIENSIKSELIENGYLIKNVKVIVDSNYENIKQIEIQLSEESEEKNKIQIEPVIIGENKIENQNYIELKNLISEKYQVAIENIYIFGK